MTKEEILDQHAQNFGSHDFYDLAWSNEINSIQNCALIAMQSYADEQTAPLLTRIAELENDKWVSVEDVLPERKKFNDVISISEEYQIYDKTYGVSKGWLKEFLHDSDDWDTLNPHKSGDICWECTHNSFSCVTHWRPLPQPPIAKAALEGTK